MSIRLAQKLGGEIICADSMQIYKYLSVGTAKATPEEMQGIPHHLMDFLEPTERFSVADYVEAANDCIRDISARGRVPRGPRPGPLHDSAAREVVKRARLSPAPRPESS